MHKFALHEVTYQPILIKLVSKLTLKYKKLIFYKFTFCFVQPAFNLIKGHL